MPRAQRLADVDRPAGQHRAVAEPQSEHEMLGHARLFRHRVEVDRAGGGIDHRRAGNAKRVDVAAWQRRTRHRPAKRGVPDDAPGNRIERVHHIALGRDDHQAVGRARWAPVQRLRVHMAFDPAIEAGILAHTPHGLPA